MKKQILAAILISLSLAACTTDKNTDSVVKEVRNIEVVESKSLSDLMLVFQKNIDNYVAKNEKNLKDLEELHLSFVPILKWENFAGNEEYKADAFAVGTLVHQMEDADGEKYKELLTSLKPAFDKFYLQYGGAESN